MQGAKLLSLNSTSNLYPCHGRRFRVLLPERPDNLAEMVRLFKCRLHQAVRDSVLSRHPESMDCPRHFSRRDALQAFLNRVPHTAVIGTETLPVAWLAKRILKEFLKFLIAAFSLNNIAYPDLVHVKYVDERLKKALMPSLPFARLFHSP